MIDYIKTNINDVAVHTVGNKTNDEELYLSKSLLDTTDPQVGELLFKLFLIPFSDPEFYSFSFSNGDFNLNPIFNFASQIFDDPDSLYENSINIAKHLYESSIHPQIKSGDVFIAFFQDISVEDQLTNAIGIFKSENRQAFLKLDNENEIFTIKGDNGINTEKLDKGCLIFNIERESGFKICTVDKSNKSVEAQYWRNTFLQLKPRNDDYHYTKDLMGITKNFVLNQFNEEFEVSKADQIDLLNRSVKYFKAHDSFDKTEFEQEVFQNDEVIKSFRGFNESYQQNHDLQIEDNFEISEQAVKNQSRAFKSVLKLDKNFHVYIHGNRNMLEQGIDNDGRKFYKLYFEKEA